MVCSFIDPIQTSTLRTSIVDIARPITCVLLGASTCQNDVISMLRDGPTHFLALTAGIEFPTSISSIIKEMADNGISAFPISEEDIRDVVGFFVLCTFGSESTRRIGACYTSNFQRLIYNIAACTIASYSDITNTSNKDNETKIASLKRATCLVAQVTEAFKEWLPVSGWLNGWTRWHALTYVLEMTNETIVESNNPQVRTPSFLLFCDEIFRHVLEEHKQNNGIESVTDLKTSFGWCACSTHFKFVIRCCTESNFNLPNARLLSAIVHHAFNSLSVVECLVRPVLHKKNTQPRLNATPLVDLDNTAQKRNHYNFVNTNPRIAKKMRM